MTTSVIGLVRARELSGAEKQHWWDVAGALNPNYARYRASSGRDIPVLALEPAEWPEDLLSGPGPNARAGTSLDRPGVVLDRTVCRLLEAVQGG
jgi:hypothetical protein